MANSVDHDLHCLLKPWTVDRILSENLGTKLYVIGLVAWGGGKTRQDKIYFESARHITINISSRELLKRLCCRVGKGGLISMEGPHFPAVFCLYSISDTQLNCIV